MEEIDFNEHLYYDESSPSCLRWKTARTCGKLGGGVRRPKDSIAGSLDTEKYWTVNTRGKVYRGHQIVWKLLNGSMEGRVIDHIDGNPSNNKISNLRLVSEAQNRRNMSQNKGNNTGVTGVCFVVHMKKGREYDVSARAHWREDDRARQKNFSVNKFGLMTAFKLACEFRQNAIKRLNEQGAGYTERHGQ